MSLKRKKIIFYLFNNFFALFYGLSKYLETWKNVFNQSTNKKTNIAQKKVENLTVDRKLKLFL